MIKKYFSAVKKYIVAHKIISGVAAVLILALAWWGYSAATSATAQVKYVLGTVSSSTIISTVSESGQVSTTDSVDIKAQVSGQITWVSIKAGQVVRAGQALAGVDNKSALQAVQSAENQLATDKLNFQKDQAQAPINYQNDQMAVDNAQTTLTNDYSTVYTDLSSVFNDLPTVVNGAQGVLYGFDLDTKKVQWNKDFLLNMFNSTYQDTSSVQSFQQKAMSDYTTGNSSYSAALSAYKNLSRTATTSVTDAMLTQAIQMQTAVAQAVQSETNFLGTVSDLAQKNNISLPSTFSTLQTNAHSYLSTANADLSKLLADKKILDSDKQTIASAKQTVVLDQVGNNAAGSNPINLQVEANNIAKEEQDLVNLRGNLFDYTIVAPFAGTVASVGVHVGDSASGSAIATIVSSSQIAPLSINEVDAAKIKLGNKATLTFDAIDGLTLTGTVANIDPVGTVSQGVVSYSVDISFDTQDARVKPGMTINATIQTAVVQDALVVPSSAVKTVSGNSFVLMFDPPLSNTGDAQGVVSDTQPIMAPVVIGVSDTTNVQILSGLTEGQQIVASTRTTSTTASAAAAVTNRTTGATRGGFGGGGNAVLIGR